MKFPNYLLSTGGIIIIVIGLILGFGGGYLLFKDVTEYWKLIGVGLFLVFEVGAFSTFIPTMRKRGKRNKG
jgi:hypothetical protein